MIMNQQSEITFEQELDSFWYRDEEEYIGDSFPEDDWDDWDDENMIFCPYCNNSVPIEELIDGVLCPVCCEDLSLDYEENTWDQDDGEENNSWTVW